jgi:Sec-independent protein secretion pathway component TatC
MSVLAAVLTPSDIIVLMMMLLLPMVALYELSILLSAMVRRERLEGVSVLVPLLAILEARNRFAKTRQRLHAAARAG